MNLKFIHELMVNLNWIRENDTKSKVNQRKSIEFIVNSRFDSEFAKKNLDLYLIREIDSEFIVNSRKTKWIIDKSAIKIVNKL